MTARVRLAAAVLGFLIPVLWLARWNAAVASPPEMLAAPELPDAIGPWTQVAEERLSEEHFAILRPDAHLWRRYEAEGRAPIWVYVATYGGRSGYQAGAHDPEVCYPAQGWEILRSRPVEVRIGNGDTLVARLLDAHQESARQVVLYWFQPAARWPARAEVEQLARVLDAVAGRPHYAFVRLAAPLGDGFDAARDLEEFAARIAQPIRGHLDELVPVASADRDREG
jgi:EpsI family protein